jgi:CheY-like chemotaxis protein
MSIEGVDVPTMKRAIQSYLDHAFGEAAAAHLPAIDFEVALSLEDVLANFHHDQRAGRMRRYTLRLGNSRYPFMKLVFQELLIRNRFFFAVDTHDEMDLKDSFPDYEKWLELKQFNAKLKERVERSWQEIGVPTFADIVAQVERETPEAVSSVPEAERKYILIVDDEKSIARGVDAILSRQGYRTRQVHTAEDAWDSMQRERPDLVISDLEMPGKTGLQLAEDMRKDRDLAQVPFILATAALIGPEHFGTIDGFLVKPYEAPLLLKFVSEHLNRRPGSSTGTLPIQQPEGLE